MQKQLDRKHAGLPGRGAGLLMMGLLVGVVVLGLASPAAALPVTLEDGSSVVTIDPGAQEGLQAWAVNGITHVRTQWFWVRVGSAGPERSVDTLGETARIVSDTNGDGHADTLFLALADPEQRFTLRLRWALSGSPFAPPTAGAAADLALQITLTNTSGAPLDVSLFQYTDVDLFGSFADDAALWSGVGGPNTALVTDSTGLAEWESVWTPRPSEVEASLYGSMLASLNDGVATVLSGATSAEARSSRSRDESVIVWRDSAAPATRA